VAVTKFNATLSPKWYLVYNLDLELCTNTLLLALYSTMQFAYSPEQKMLVDSAQRFVRDHCDFNQRTKRLESGQSFASENWHSFAELGWTALLVSEQNNGLGAGLGDLLALQQELGAGLAMEPFVSSIVQSASLLDWLASSVQISQWLEPVMATEKRLSLAVLEPAKRYSIAQPSTSAVKTKNGYQLSGHKVHVIDGDGADGYIVSANVETQGCALFIIDANASGVSIQQERGTDDRNNCQLILDTALVGDDGLLCTSAEGAPLLTRAQDLAAAATCADMVGCMRALLDITVDYTKQRHQFGQPIGKFQVLQHRMADMFIALQRARSMLVMLVMSYDDHTHDGVSFSKAVSAAKVQINESAQFVGQQAVQIHGGIGTTDELNVSHYFKRLIVNQTIAGDSRHHLQRYSSYS